MGNVSYFELHGVKQRRNTFIAKTCHLCNLEETTEAQHRANSFWVLHCRIHGSSWGRMKWGCKLHCDQTEGKAVGAHMNRPHTGMHIKPAYVTMYSFLSSLPIFRFSTWTVEGHLSRELPMAPFADEFRSQTGKNTPARSVAKQGIHTHLQATTGYLSPSNHSSRLSVLCSASATRHEPGGTAQEECLTRWYQPTKSRSIYCQPLLSIWWWLHFYQPSIR